jgi:hypothetical protein
MPNVFISHSNHDQPFIDEILLPAFRSHGISFWYSKEDIKTADEWERSIVQGLEECQWFLVVLTEKAETSKWLKAEVQWAMEHREKKIIPVLLRDCDITRVHLVLNTIQYTDLRRDQQAGLQSLVNIWDKQAQPTEKPKTNRFPAWLTIVLTFVVLFSITIGTIFYTNTHNKALTAPPVDSARNYSNDTGALIDRAQSLMQLHSYSEALEVLQKVIPLVRDPSRLFYQQGIALYDIAEFEASVTAFTKAIDAGYPDQQIYVDRGDALRRAGQTPDACKDYALAKYYGKADGLEKYQEYCPFMDSLPLRTHHITSSH